MASASTVLISCYIKPGTWSLLWAACGATSPWAEAQQQPAPVVKWLLITQERIAPNHFLSTAHFHETQNSHTLLCNSSLGFCEWSFVVTSAALGGMQGSAFACSFSFPSFSFPVYIHGVLFCWRAPKSHGIYSLGIAGFYKGFLLGLGGQMVTVEIVHDPEQIKGKLGTPSLDR